MAQKKLNNEFYLYLQHVKNVLFMCLLYESSCRGGGAWFDHIHHKGRKLDFHNKRKILNIVTWHILGILRMK